MCYPLSLAPEAYRVTTPATVDASGDVFWVPPATHQVRCPVNGHIINCTLEFGSWTFTGSDLDLDLRSEEGFDIKSFIPHGDYDLLATPGRKEVKLYACCPEPYIKLIFNIILRRKSN